MPSLYATDLLVAAMPSVEIDAKLDSLNEREAILSESGIADDMIENVAELMLTVELYRERREAAFSLVITEIDAAIARMSLFQDKQAGCFEFDYTIPTKTAKQSETDLDAAICAHLEKRIGDGELKTAVRFFLDAHTVKWTRGVGQPLVVDTKN